MVFFHPFETGSSMINVNRTLLLCFHMASAAIESQKSNRPPTELPKGGCPCPHDKLQWLPVSDVVKHDEFNSAAYPHLKLKALLHNFGSTSHPLDDL